MQSRLPPDTPFWWLQQSLLSLSLSLSLLNFLDLKGKSLVEETTVGLLCFRMFHKKKESLLLPGEFLAGSDLNSSTGVQSSIAYTLHHVFEVALKSPNEMLSITCLAHGRSVVHFEGRSHWAIPSAAPDGSKT